MFMGQPDMLVYNNNFEGLVKGGCTAFKLCLHTKPSTMPLALRILLMGIK